MCSWKQVSRHSHGPNLHGKCLAGEVGKSLASPDAESSKTTGRDWPAVPAFTERWCPSLTVVIFWHLTQTRGTNECHALTRETTPIDFLSQQGSRPALRPESSWLLLKFSLQMRTEPREASPRKMSYHSWQTPGRHLCSDISSDPPSRESIIDQVGKSAVEGWRSASKLAFIAGTGTTWRKAYRTWLSSA